MIESPLPLPFGDHLWSPKGSPLNEEFKQGEPRYLSNVLKALNTPWKPLELQIPTTPAPLLSREELSSALSELAKDTTVTGPPSRIWPARPRQGVIGDHRNGQEVGWPPKYAPIPSCSPDSSIWSSPEPFYESPPSSVRWKNSTLPILAPIPVVAIPRACFEVKAYTSHLPPSLAQFGEDSFESAMSRWFEEEDEFEVEAFDENKVPGSFFTDSHDAEKDTTVLSGPALLRGTREPFGVLHFDAEEVPMDAYVESLDEKGGAFPVAYDSDSEFRVVKMRTAKGWARLRSKAPCAIDMDLVKAGDELEKGLKAAEAQPVSVVRELTPSVATGGNEADEQGNVQRAPLIASAPLPPGAPLGHVTGAVVRALIPKKPEWWLPLTPHRASLLNILNGR